MVTTWRHVLCILSGAVILGCATSSGGIRIDNVPMYGQPEVPRPEFLKLADETFIAQATAGFGSREKASHAWWLQAEEFMQRGDLDFAMRRYNQSWLLNPSNYQPYWGFGRVMLTQNRCDEAIRHFARARELVNDKFEGAALLSDFGVAYGYCATLLSPDQGKIRTEYFEKSNRMFVESTQLDPSYSMVWLRWSQILLEEDRPAEAWEKLKQARAAGAQIPSVYVERLTKRMAEPK